MRNSNNYDEICPDHLLCVTKELVHLINGLDLSKANGPGGIAARMLKATADSIAPSLTNLLNLSISNGKFPKTWKEARIALIPKSTTKHSPSGYSFYRYLASSSKSTSTC